jgi:hypothetical protein
LSKSEKITVFFLLAAIILSAFSFSVSAGDDNATGGDGSAHSAAEGFGWYNYNEYLYKVTLYAGKSDTASKQSSLLNDFYKIGTVIVKKTGWTISESVLFGSATKAEYYSGTPMTQLVNPLIISDANCPKIPIVTFGDIDVVKQYFGSTGTMNTLLNALANNAGTSAYGLLRNKTFTIGGVTKSGWADYYLLPNGTTNRIPWAIIYEPMVVLHLKDKVNMVAFTATEFAIAYENGWYDWYYNYGHGQAVQSLTFKHLPSSIQLEESWFGYPVYPTYDDSHFWPTLDIIKGGGWGMRWLGANGSNSIDLSCEIIQYDPSPVIETSVKHVIRWYNNKSVPMTALCEIYSGDYLITSRTLSIPGNSYVTTTQYLTYHATVTHKINARINYANRDVETDPNNNMSTVTVIPRSSSNPAKDYGCYFGTVETPEANGHGLVTVTWRNYKRDYGNVLCELYRDDTLVWSAYKSFEGYESITEAYSVYYPGADERTLTAKINYEDRFSETDPNDNMRQTKVKPVVPVDNTYDLSVDWLYVDHSEVDQGDTVTVEFVSDNWNKDLEYDDILVELLVDDVVVSSERVHFDAYGRNYHSCTLALEDAGTKTIAARINWENRFEEDNSTNNYTSTTAVVRPYYEFSVTGLKVTPAEVNSSGSIEISFRTDNWDHYNEYKNIPVQLLYDSKVVYTEYVDYEPYSGKNHKLSLNVGSNTGSHEIYVRINWQDHLNEINVNNNETDTAVITVIDPADLWIEPVEPNSDYRAGTQVITSFIMHNDSASDVIPSDNNTVSFEAYYYSGQTKVSIKKLAWYNAVVPANDENLVYFKWTVPADAAGKKVYAEATVNSGMTITEANYENNTGKVIKTAAPKLYSSTPDTRYEREKPADYTAATVPSPTTAEMKWTIWEYKNGAFVKAKYGIKMSASTPEITPDSNSPSAEKKNGQWVMKSGYGIEIECNPSLTSVGNGYSLPATNSYTAIQTAYATFPEFGYKTVTNKYKTLEKNGMVFNFEENPIAEGKGRIHFTPIWYPDGDYCVSVTYLDFWTPAGMATAIRTSNTITISGSAYDDWFLGR